MRKNIDYIAIINKYLGQNTKLFGLYIQHVTLVTAKALEAANKLELDKSQIRFIEEASMLHDIGIIKVNNPEIYCDGNLDYICHGNEGRKILENEGLYKHALVAERHTGVGLTKQDIIKQKLPIPKRDMLAKSVEEKIISWADLFYSKNPDSLFIKKSIKQIRKSVSKYGREKVELFDEWQNLFG